MKFINIINTLFLFAILFKFPFYFILFSYFLFLYFLFHFSSYSFFHFSCPLLSLSPLSYLTRFPLSLISSPASLFLKQKPHTNTLKFLLKLEEIKRVKLLLIVLIFLLLLLLLNLLFVIFEIQPSLGEEEWDDPAWTGTRRLPWVLPKWCMYSQHM